MKSLFKENYKLFIELQCATKLPKDLLTQYPTLHFCYEWDEMLIDEGCPEFEVCNCLLRGETQGEGTE